MMLGKIRLKSYFSCLLYCTSSEDPDFFDCGEFLQYINSKLNVDIVNPSTAKQSRIIHQNSARPNIKIYICIFK